MEFISFFLIPERRENNITGSGVDGREGDARRLISDRRTRVVEASAASEQSDRHFNFLPDGECLTFGRRHKAEQIAFRKGLVESSSARSTRKFPAHGRVRIKRKV